MPFKLPNPGTLGGIGPSHDTLKAFQCPHCSNKIEIFCTKDRTTGSGGKNQSIASACDIPEDKVWRGGIVACGFQLHPIFTTNPGGPPIEENVEEPLHLTVGCGNAVVTYLWNQMNGT
jgi:hypothetical protein